MVPIGKTERTPGRRLGPIFGFGVPGAMLGIVGAWMLGVGSPRGVQAQGGPAQATGNGLMALTTSAPGDPGGTRLVLIDQRTQAMAIYKIDGFKGGSIKLESARQFGPDLRLSEYNNLPPEVAAVEAMVAAPRPRGTPGQ
jgi:hypothetical protein